MGRAVGARFGSPMGGIVLIPIPTLSIGVLAESTPSPHLAGSRRSSAWRGARVEGAAYYQYLASTLPASELGQAVWRRLRRATLKRVHHLLPRDRHVDVVAALGLTSAEDLAARLRGDRAARA